MNLNEIRNYYIETIKFINEVANDIVNNNCSKKVINYAEQYVHLENEDSDFLRINWSGVYAYVALKCDGSPTGNLWWDNSDIGCGSMGCEDAIKTLETMSDEEIMELEETSYFEGDELFEDFHTGKYEPLNLKMEE